MPGPTMQSAAPRRPSAQQLRCLQLVQRAGLLRVVPTPDHLQGNGVAKSTRMSCLRRGMLVWRWADDEHSWGWYALTDWGRRCLQLWGRP